MCLKSFAKSQVWFTWSIWWRQIEPNVRTTDGEGTPSGTVSWSIEIVQLRSCFNRQQSRPFERTIDHILRRMRWRRSFMVLIEDSSQRGKRRQWIGKNDGSARNDSGLRVEVRRVRTGNPTEIPVLCSSWHYLRQKSGVCGGRYTRINASFMLLSAGQTRRTRHYENSVGHLCSKLRSHT